MFDLASDIASRPCPKCLYVGGMVLLGINATITCRKCMGSYLDPFEIGPWDSLVDLKVVDTYDDSVVSSYQFSTVPTPENMATTDENMLDFYKYLVEEKKLEGG